MNRIPNLRRMVTAFGLTGLFVAFFALKESGPPEGVQAEEVAVKGRHNLYNIGSLRDLREKKNTEMRRIRDNSTNFSIPFCNCKRIGLRMSGQPSKMTSSHCSDFATQRGSNQKVISYSYFNPNDNYVKDSFHSQKYLTSLLDRAKEVENYYPGWLMRLYHNISESDAAGQEVLCDFFCNYQHVDLCDVRHLPVLGNVHEKQSGPSWRFLVMGDPTVQVFNCRDADSIIQEREVDAVKEWLQSDKTFHVMRDFPGLEDVMLAGLWGCKNAEMLERLATLRHNIFSRPNNHTYGYDQHLLATEVWPVAKKSVLQHDSFSCTLPAHAGSSPFPTKRTNDFYLGWGPHHKTASLDEFRSSVCPIQCRPDQHQDWETC